MWIDIPAGFTKLLNHKDYNWNFEMEAEDGMAGRRIPCPRDSCHPPDSGSGR